MVSDINSGSVNRTRVFCPLCRASHDAAIERRNGEIHGRVFCPRGERTTRLSSDADLFLKIRARGRRPSLGRFLRTEGVLLSLLDVTSGCNFRCPICYADSGREATPYFLPVGEALQRVQAAKSKGIWEVTLMGGEPTVHPGLIEMVRGIRAFRLRPVLVSNGLLLGEDPSLAERLKAAGLAKVNLQFDTFDVEVHRRMRGNDFVDRKIAALHNVLRAGLSLGIITTVTRLNLKELKRIVEFALSFAPQLSTITLDPATPDGRYEIPADTVVDREEVIHELIDSQAISGVTADHFWPVPHYRPWGMQVHPDCGAALYLRVGDGRGELVDDIVDLGSLFNRMAANTMGASKLARNLVLVHYILRATKPGRWLDVLKSLAGLIRTSPRRGLGAVYIGSFVGSAFWDMERIAGCPASFLTKEGLAPPCLHYSPLKQWVLRENERRCA
jgi:molybdenum cofactor biosynthesis enzyme MoaA